MKTTIATILAILLMFGTSYFCSVTFLDSSDLSDSSTMREESGEEVYIETPTVGGETYALEDAYEHAYSVLNAAQQDLYKKMKTVICDSAYKEFQSVEWGDASFSSPGCIIIPSGVMTGEEASEVLWCLMNDHPEVFWLDSLLYVDDDGEKMTMFLSFHEEFKDTEIRNSIIQMLQNASEKYCSGMQSMDDAAKVFYLVEVLSDYYRYAEKETGEAEISSWSATLASYIDGRAICCGYAKAFQYFAEKAGLQVIYVSGHVDEGYHAWNYVYVSETKSWYGVDLTFDDCGVDSVLKGMASFADHVPAASGYHNGIYGYDVPNLANEDYMKKEPDVDKTEVPETAESENTQPAQSNNNSAVENEEEVVESETELENSTSEAETGQTEESLRKESDVEKTEVSETSETENEQVEDSKQKKAEWYCDFASAASDSGDHMQAIAYYKASLDYVKAAGTYYNIAREYHCVENYERACEYYAIAASMEHDLAYGMFINAINEGFINGDQPNMNKAFGYYLQLVAIEPDPDIYYCLSVWSDTLYENKDAAVKYIKRAIELDTNEKYQSYLDKLYAVD